jgi:phospho-N-acetylmuramoyl-pentapeptide-transferase
MLGTLTNYALLAFSLTAVFAPLLINILYRFNIVVRHRLMKNKMNEEFIRLHSHKSGTPRSGGLMISVTVGLLTLLFVPHDAFRMVFLMGWTIFSLYGFADDLVVSIKKISDRFRLLQESFFWRIGKLGLLYLLTATIIAVAVNALHIQQLSIVGDLYLELNTLNILLLAFFAIFAIYGIEITDGLDGLVAGQFLLAFVVFAVLSILSGRSDLLPYIGLLIGSMMVYLYFNITPARVFMGASGTFPVAFALLLFTLVTNSVLPFLILGTPFWIELFSSAVQILSIKFRGKKVFRIAPIHHHFEALGWPEAKVVQRFWLAAALAGLLALWIYTLI